MNSKEEFEKFLENLRVENAEDILVSYKGVTNKCNQTYWDSESEDDNGLQVGSFGRDTAIHGISDLDMIFRLPDSLFKQYDSHEGNGQSALLQDVRNTLKEIYPNSDIKADGQVVKFEHTNYTIELVPGFLRSDGGYDYPDTNDGGSWKVTRPVEEINEIATFDSITGGVLKKLCRVVRAWKNKTGVAMGGLLIDTLCYNFLKEKTSYHNCGLEKYPLLCRDFFDYCANTNEEQQFWLAPGSNQQVVKKVNFVPKVKKAYNTCLKAIEEEGNESARKYWKKIFGRPFPAKEVAEKGLSEAKAYDDTEEFIEDKFRIDIRESLSIDCRVSQHGFLKHKLRFVPYLKSKYSLEFYIESTSAKSPYDIYWKVLNIGSEAERRNCIRGQIVRDSGSRTKTETSNFRGEHYVECYIVKNNVVIARDSIPVNIDYNDSP